MLINCYAVKYEFICLRIHTFILKYKTCYNIERMLLLVDLTQTLYSFQRIL